MGIAPREEIESRRPGGERLPFVDGLRNLLVLLVVAGHLPWFVTLPTVLQFLNVGNYRVPIFLMISGFVLYVSSADRERIEASHAFRETVVRRLRRLLPGWYGALALALVVGHALQLAGSPFAALVLPKDAADVLLHLTLLHGSWTASGADYSHSWLLPGWSLGADLSLSLFFLPFLALARRWGWLALVAFGLLVAAPFPEPIRGVVRAAFNVQLTIPFLLGMIAARYARRPWQEFATVCGAGGLARDAWLDRFRAALLVAVAATIGLVAYLPPTVFGWLTSLLAGLSLVYWAHRPHSRGARFFSHPALLRLGSTSYSLYLTHFPVLATLATLTASLPVAAGWKPTLFLCAAFPVTLLCALAFARLFDVRPPTRRPSPTSARRDNVGVGDAVSRRA
jgi:peptidoglycan/LPS O-acetylase OafA/YrhL